MDETTQTQQQNDLLEFFKALSNVDRLKVVGLLAVKPLTAAQIAARLGCPVQAAIKHLDYLAHFGLLKPEGAGSAEKASLNYRLDTSMLHQMSQRVLAGSRPRLTKDDFEGDDFERKVLSENIAPDGTLKAIPLQSKKRLVILRHLLQAFEPGQRYPEKQVNELLKRFHPDSATLRRCMVDERMMARENGVYWRL